MDNKLARVMELRNIVTECNEELKVLDRELADYARQIAPKPIYGKQEITTSMPHNIEYLTITTYLLNLDAKNDHLHKFGSISGDWKEQRRSVMYYRTEDNVLTHTGGGYVLLKDCLICSDEEWNSIKNGKFGRFTSEY